MSALQPSTVLATSGPLRWKSQANGVPKVQGVFTMRDEQGFPMDMSYEIAREKGWNIDWLEAMADAARQCILKLDALLAEMRLLLPMAEVESWTCHGANQKHHTMKPDTHEEPQTAVGSGDLLCDGRNRP